MIIHINDYYAPGVMIAVETVIKELKSKSKMVTTPEEIAQVIINTNITFHFSLLSLH